MTPWRQFIRDFKGLTEAVADQVHKRTLATKLSHDIQTIKRWLKTGEPSSPRDVGWMVRIALQHAIDISRFQTFAPVYDLSTSWNYELNMKADLPDFSWLTNTAGPPTVPTRFCGVDIDTPMGVSASPLTGDYEWTKLMLDLGFGLSTFKTRRTAYKSAHVPPQIAYVQTPPDLSSYDPESPLDVHVTCDRDKVVGLIPNLVNSLGVPSENPSDWRALYERISAHERGKWVGISVMGDGAREPQLLADLRTAVAHARECKPPFVELNLSCPNLKDRVDVYEYPDLVRRLCRGASEVLKGTGIPLVIKLPYLPKQKMRDLLDKTGGIVQAITLRNTIRVRPFEVEENGGRRISPFKGREFGGLSGPCTFPLTVRGLKDLLDLRSELRQEFEIIAVGGISSPADAVEIMNLGARAGVNILTQVTTGPIFDPFLAWKSRFHLERARVGLEPVREEQMLAPRDAIELASLKNAIMAQATVNSKKGSQLKVTDKTLCREWNKYVVERSREPLGRAARTTPPRTTADWITAFTAEK